MKVVKPGTDCQADFRILANGRVCEEYLLPNSAEEPTAGVCFIPVPDNATITIQGTFSGSMLYGRVDVLADGAFIANRVIEDHESKEGIVKYRDNRKVEIKTFLHVPDLNDYKQRMRPNVVEGNLVTKRLSDKELSGPLHGGNEATGIGVGSITLILSLNQDVLDTYHAEGREAAYPSVSLSHWRDSTSGVADSGIRPEHEMRMDVFPDSNPVKNKKATLFWRDLRAPRFGSGPWANLIFYYRSQAVIDAAGCVPLTNGKALPVAEGTFVQASNRELLTCQEERSWSPPPPPPLSGPTYTEAAATKKPKGLLGQTLSFGSDQLTNDSAAACTASTRSEQLGSLLNATQPSLPESDTIKQISNHISPKGTYPVPPLLKQKDKPHSSKHPKPRVSFSNPLTTSTPKEDGMTDSFVACPAGEDDVDDMALPTLPAHASQPSLARSGEVTSRDPNIDPRLFEPPSVARSDRGTSREPLVDQRLFEPPSHKRPASQANLTASPSSSASGTSSPAKRLRSEELREKKLQLERALQEKRERKAAMQEKLNYERMERERQQQLWAEEDARRRDEEERRRKAEVEEEEEARKAEAEMAELEALQRANEMEDFDLERVAENNDSEFREWEEIVRARGQSGRG